MVQWTFALVAFLIVAVPELDREWNPLLEPYREAKKLEDLGAMVFQGHLSETQIGFINLTFGHTLAPVPPGPAARAALERSGPVVLLLEPKALKAGDYGSPATAGLELPTQASQSAKLWERAPVLYLNRAAAELLEQARDAGPLAAKRSQEDRPPQGQRAPPLPHHTPWAWIAMTALSSSRASALGR
jgi:hypothetical protein